MADYVFQLRMQYYRHTDENERIEFCAHKYTDEHLSSIEGRSLLINGKIFVAVTWKTKKGLEVDIKWILRKWFCGESEAG